MFHIPNPKTLKLHNVNGRKEHHGEELVQAVDLSLSGNFPNSALTMLHAALLPAMFTQAGPAASDDVQREMDLPVADLPNMRFSKLGYPLKWDLEIMGATLSIHYGAGKPIVLSLCKVKDFRVTPLEGGTVEIAFKLSCAANIDEKILGKLGIMSGTDIEVTLIEPKAEGAAPPLTETPFKEPPASGKVTPIKATKKGSLGTDAEQAQRQAEVLAQDKSQAPEGGWPFPTLGDSPKTPEEALAAGAGK